MRRGLLAGLALSLAAACVPSDKVPEKLSDGNWLLSRAGEPQTPDDVYYNALHTGYLAFAEEELARYEWWDAQTFIDKAELAAEGAVVPMLEAEDGTLPEELAARLAEGRSTLARYVAAPGPRKRAALQIGEAQVAFDIWHQAAEDGYDDALIAELGDEFDARLELVKLAGDLPGNMAVVLPKDGETGGVVVEEKRGSGSVLLDSAFAAVGTGDRFGDLAVDEQEIRDAFAAAAGAMPPPSRWFCVTFPFNSARVTDENFGPILEAAFEVRRREAAAEVLMTGQADRPGLPGDNLALSRQRVAAVRAELLRQLDGVRDRIFSIRAVGERQINLPDADCPNTERRVIIQVR